jgi:DNA-binding phage protein
MALTKQFRLTVLERAHHDVKFRHALLAEALNELLSGDVDVGKSLLRDYINATISFELLASKLHKNSKSVQRMLSSTGNPTTKSLMAIFHVLQKMEGVKIRVDVQ